MLVLFVGIVAQLSTADGVAETLWVLVSIAGAVLVAIGITLLVRRGRGGPGGGD